MMSKAKIDTQSFREYISELQPSNQFTVYEVKEFARKTVSYNRRDFYKVSLTWSTGTLFYADKSILIDRPALIFSNPMLPYAWEGICDSQKGFFCLFNEDFLKDIDRDVAFHESSLFKIGADPVFFIDEPQLMYISSIFENMLREFHSNYSYKFDLLRSHLNLLLHEAMKMQPVIDYLKNQNAKARISSLFLELLDRQFPIDTPQYQLKFRTAKDYAGSLSVHVNYLNRAVKEVTGKTTTEHLTERMVLESKALLKHTNWSITDIAYSLGYDYPTYFNNFFKKQTGVTPTSLR